MGVDASQLEFKSILDNGKEMFTYGEQIKALASSKTFPSSISPEKTALEQQMNHRIDVTRLTQEAISKKIWMATIVPVLVAATVYLVIMLAF